MMPSLVVGFVAIPIVSLIAAVVVRILRARRRVDPAYGAPSGDETDLAEIGAWYRVRCAEGALHETVSDRTWRDLELDPLFRSVDHTRTPLGRQQLFAMLRTRAEPRERTALLALADAMAADPALRTDVETALRGHRGSGGYRLHALLRTTDFDNPWLRVAPLMTVTSVSLLAIAPWHHAALLWLLPLLAAGLVLRSIVTAHVNRFIGPLRELAPVLRAARRLAMHPHPAFAPFRSALHPTGGFVRRVERVARFASQDVLTSNDLAGSLLEYVNMVLMLDANALLAVRNDLRRHRATIEQLFIAIGQIDVARAIGSIRSGWPRWCRPEHAPEGAMLEGTDVAHPLLPNGVTNTVHLHAGRGMLLTGANMSGKSTWLRTLGVNVIVGAALDICAASRMVLPVDQVETCIGHHDNLAAGKSYFYAEAEVVVQLLRSAASSRRLFLFDELFRGTNAAERVAAAEAVMREVLHPAVDGAGQFVALATHDMELTRLLSDCFDTWHLAVETVEGHVHFLYRLEAGPAKTRTALTLLRSLGAPADLIARATTRAAALEHQVVELS